MKRIEISEDEWKKLFKNAGGWDKLSVYGAHTAPQGDEFSPHGEILTILCKKGEDKPFIECIRSGFYPDETQETHKHYKYLAE